MKKSNYNSNDYEQLYYDSKYEIGKLNKQIYLLTQELEVIKKFSGKKTTKYLINEIFKYLKNKDKSMEYVFEEDK